MARLPKHHPARQPRTPQRRQFGRYQGWRNATSVVGRGDTRCEICQEVLLPEDDIERYEGQNAHAKCVEMEG